MDDGQDPNAPLLPVLNSIGSDVRVIVECMRPYLGREPLWADDSECANDHAPGSAVADLKTGSPAITLAIQPVQVLAQAQANLTALAQVVLEPTAMLPVLTLMRPTLAACGWVYYVLAIGGDDRERHRRLMNLYLSWTGETLNYMNGNPSTEIVQARRTRLVQVARTAGHKVSTPGKRAAANYWPVWHIGDKAPSEMDRLAALFHADTEIEREVGHDLFRLMSAATHAQPQSVYAILRAADISDRKSGSYNAQGAFKLSTLMGWLYAVGAFVNRAMVLSGGYYGWDLREWEAVTHPRISAWRKAVQVAAMQP
jgi:hypothetical protein